MSSPSSQSITARSGSNLALAFVCLPPERRRAMSIFYAFCRVVDDAADSETLSLAEKKEQLTFWREEIRRAYLSKPESELGQEMAEIIRTYLIPPTPLEEILNGVEMDLSKFRYETFSELEKYCYRVASAVGLVSIEIFSYRQPQTKDYAVALGMAFQLTNILRDISKDASYGRIYLPLDEIQAHGLSESDILLGNNSPAMQKFLRFQYHRAKYYFSKSLRLIHPDDRQNLTAAEIMREVYETLLERIRADGFRLRNPPLRLSKPEKVLCILRAQRKEKVAAALPPRPKNVLILGGGLAGLSAAFYLTKKGHQVTVLEGRSQLGGRAHSFKDSKSGEIVDNGQHILMGCYREALAFLDQLGASGKLIIPRELEVSFSSSRGNSILKSAHAPSPFHLLGGLIGYRELNARDQFAALRIGFDLRFGKPPGDKETAQQWLLRLGQTDNLIRALWEPLCLAALNQSLQVSSAKLLAIVLRRALFAAPQDSTLILSRVGLSELFGPEIQSILSMCGGSILLQKQVSALSWDGDRLKGVTTLDGSTYRADHYISALPWNSLRPLLPPDAALRRICEGIQDSSIFSLYLWLDRPLEIPMIQGFLDSPLHWLFNRGLIEGRFNAGRHAYVAVISGANDLLKKSTEELENLIWSEICRLLPSSREAKIVNRFAYKALSATFSATPEVEILRPDSQTIWKNFWLAGDWTNTGLPATIEGAVLSGRKVAEKLDQAR